jgi:DMSO/TMAO reductase YedYZ molybdopterin-dependent catalytic subunit
MQHKPISRRSFLRSALNAPTDQSPSAVLPFYNEDGYTPNSHFYRQHLNNIPQITPVYWMMRLYGLVEKPLAFSYDDLLAMPSIEQTCTLACVGSSARTPMIGNARWKGVPLSHLLEQITISPTARYAQLHAADGYTTYLEVDILDTGMLAYQMNGEALPPEHGYPVRLIVPGLYGYKMPKWIQRIEFTDQPMPGSWEKRGWSPTGEVQTTSAIFSPRHLENISGTVQLAGIAYAGQNTVERVEISVNDATWMPVNIIPAPANQWTRWQIDWMPPTPGDYLIRVRASDNTGFIQTADVSAFPNGPTALHQIVVRVVE